MKYLFLILPFLVFSQNKITASAHVDTKLMVVGDEARGYSSGTLDLLIRTKMQGNQEKFGYFIVLADFEYAQLLGDYYRYSANIGYTLNKILPKTEFTIAGGWGSIDRYGKNLFSFGASAETSYEIFKGVRLSGLLQLVERKDLGWLWGDTKWKTSGFLGLEFNVFTKK